MKRLLLILSEVLLLVCVAALMLSPDAVIDLARSIEDIAYNFRLAFVALFAVLIIMLIVMQVRWSRGEDVRGLIVKNPKVRDVITEMSVDSVAGRLQRVIAQLPDVSTVSAQVRTVDGKADVDLDVTLTHSDINVPQKQNEITQVLRKVLNDQMHLQLSERPRIRFHFDHKSDEVAAALKQRTEKLRQTRDL